MRSMEDLSALDTMLFQELFNDFLPAPFCLNHRMWQFAKKLLRQPALYRWMILPHEAHERMSNQELLKNVDAIKIREISDRKIDLTSLKRGQELSGRQRHCRHIDARSETCHPL